MAHNIETHGTEAAFVGRTPAWHQLGTVTDRATTVSEALRMAHLGGWNVRREPLFVPVGTGEEFRMIAVPDRVATVRDNPWNPGQVDPLGVVSPRYTVVQNEEVAQFAELIADQGLNVDAAGSLDDGRRVFFTFALPEVMKVAGSDEVQMFFVVWSSHDGSLAVGGQATPIRVVCQNTLSATLASDADWRFRFVHMGDGIKGRVQDAREAIGLALASGQQFTDVADRWAQRAVTDAEFDKIVDGLFPLKDDALPITRTTVERKRMELVEVLHSSPTVAAIRDNAWGVLNAVTEWQEWYCGPEDTDKAARRRLDSPTLLTDRAAATRVIARTLNLQAAWV